MTKPYKIIPSKNGSFPNGVFPNRVLTGISGSGNNGLNRKVVARTRIKLTKHKPKLRASLFLKNKMIVFSIFVFLVFFSAPVQSNCVGRFVNPITDICWSCLFPITIGGIRVSSAGEDTENPRSILCKCPMPSPPWVRIGIPISFWEPVRLVDVTRTPYCLVSLGGISLMDKGIQGRGSVGNNSGNRMRHSFYHVHWYIYPLICAILLDYIQSMFLADLHKAQF